MLRGLLFCLLTLLVTPTVHAPHTWFVRADGGTRFSPNVPLGQCDGLADAPYPGVGSGWHCAFNDVRYLWDDDSGKVGAGQWVIAGGDTVIIAGCKALDSASNVSDPNCRLGWDKPTGDALNKWCYGVGSYTCYNPPIPAGTAERHTRILGKNYATCNAGGVTDPSKYVGNLTQLYAGFSLAYALNLQGTEYVDLGCIELTTHNGQCSTVGSPASPRPCKTDQPLDDYALNGILTNDESSNITLQDVYVHGFNSSGLTGPIGGPFILTRVNSSFNAFAGWNFDDGKDTPDAPGSSITQSYVTMIGNGCQEEYPVVHAFPARACWDSNSAGFGDAWSGQDTLLDSFTCDHCTTQYNTKDAALGPHTRLKTLRLTNTTSLGNMGQQEKWGMQPGSAAVFENNVIVGNCNRMSEQLPGAGQSFNQSTGLPGAYLTNFCRAAGDVFSFIADANSTVRIANNTIVAESNTIFDLDCATAGACASSPINLTHNIFLGYTPPASSIFGGQAPGLYYRKEPSVVVVASGNDEFGIRNGDTGAANLYVDPLFAVEPAFAGEASLDALNPALTAQSPAVGMGHAPAPLLVPVAAPVPIVATPAPAGADWTAIVDAAIKVLQDALAKLTAPQPRTN